MSDSLHGSADATTSDDYAAVYYHDYSGPPYTYEEQHWKTFFGRIADEIIALFAPTSAYDAGCAKGFLVRALADRGVDARGGDISAFAIAGAPAGLAERLEVKDLTEPFNRRYDVISCVEVLEHMAPEDALAAIENVCAATDVVILSTTPDDFAEPTHVNIRQAAGWSQDFGSHGFFRRTDIDASFLSPWAVVFAKQKVSAVQLVSRYEALLQPTLREVTEKRRALLDLRRQLDEAVAPVMVERDRLMTELDAMRSDRDVAVGQRNAMATELDEFRGTDVLLSQLAVVDELMGAKAELAQVTARTEKAIAESDRDAAVLRDLLIAATDEAARVRFDAEERVRLANAMSADADERVRRANEDRDRAVAEVMESMSWRIGQVALLPIRLARRVRSR